MALAIWPPDKTLAKTCADFSDLEKLVRMVVSTCSVTGPPQLRGSMTSRQVAASQRSLMLRGRDGKPEGLAFTAQGRAVVELDTRKPRRNLSF